MLNGKGFPIEYILGQIVSSLLIRTYWMRTIIFGAVPCLLSIEKLGVPAITKWKLNFYI
jgi:hypothetical protein